MVLADSMGVEEWCVRINTGAYTSYHPVPHPTRSQSGDFMEGQKRVPRFPFADDLHVEINPADFGRSDMALRLAGIAGESVVFQLSRIDARRLEKALGVVGFTSVTE